MISSNSSADNFLDSLIYYDDLRLNRIDGVDVNVTRDDSAKVDWIRTSEGEEFALCHIGSIMSLTLGGSYPSVTGFEEAAGIALALEHLNTGNGSIVPSVNGLSERCPIRFTTEFLDNQLDTRTAVKNAVDLMDRPAESLDTRRACAFIGARSSALTVPTALLTSVNDFVQVSALATSTVLEDASQYPLFARTTPTDASTAVGVLRYLYEELGVRHLALVNVNDALGNTLAESMRAASQNLYGDGAMVIQQIPVDETEPSFKEVVSNLKRTKFRYIYATLHTRNTYDELMLEAVRQGVAGDGHHQWFFAHSLDLVNDKGVEKGSEIHLAYQNAGQIEGTILTILPGTDKPASFLEQLGAFNNPTDLAYLNSIFPHKQHQGSELYESMTAEIRNGQFLTDMAMPTIQARNEALAYDAAIAIGLGACHAFASKGASFTGKDHFDGMVNSVFRGITGTIELDPVTGTRGYAGASYQVINFRTRDVNGTHVDFESVITDRLVDGSWNKLDDFLFSDGTAQILPDIPPIELDDHAISPAIRITVLVLCAFAIGLSLFFSIWTIQKRASHVVRASQPFFLHTISIGTIIMASSMIPLTFDHVTASEQGNVVACNLTLWLIFLGFCVTFSALFTKNYRINRILTSAHNLRRVTISIKEAVVPMLCLLACNAVVLSIMTALAPIQFETEIIDLDQFGRTIETVSACSFDDGQGLYLAILAAINAGCLLFAIFQAYQARHLSTEFGESHYVFLALLIVLLVCLVGIPVLLLASDNKDAYTFVAGAIVWVTCCSILLVMFVPKIQYYTKNRDNTEQFRESLQSLTKNIAKSSFDVDDSILGGIQIYGNLTKEELLLKTDELSEQIQRLEMERDQLREKLKVKTCSRPGDSIEMSIQGLPPWPEDGGLEQGGESSDLQLWRGSEAAASGERASRAATSREAAERSVPSSQTTLSLSEEASLGDGCVSQATVHA